MLVSPSSVNIMFPTTNTHGESNYKDLEKGLCIIVSVKRVVCLLNGEIILFH